MSDDTRVVRDDIRMVSAPVFQAWWDQLGELAARHPHDPSLGKLFRRLADAGRASGATIDGEEGILPGDPRLTPTVRNLAFDWQHGAIAFGPMLVDGREIRAEQLIAELTLATGVPRGTQPPRP